jgi:hypothetical protein
MERLEAALAKAREMRRDTLGQPVADRVRPVPTEAPGRVWADLPEVTILPERARTHRISTCCARARSGR